MTQVGSVGAAVRWRGVRRAAWGVACRKHGELQAPLQGPLLGAGERCPAALLPLACHACCPSTSHFLPAHPHTEERKRRMEFEIVREDLPPSMTVIESPAAAAQAAREAEDPFLP